MQNPIFHPLYQQEYIIDQKRGIILNTRDLNHQQNYFHTRNFFKTFRPDLSDYDYFVFKERLILGERYLAYLKDKLNYETGRVFMQYPVGYLREKIKVLRN